MIDIHCHILPDLDDGAKDRQETLDMCAIARNDGIRTIVATPHVKRGMYTPAKELIISKVAELNTLLAPRSSPPSSNVKSETLEVTSHSSRFTSHDSRFTFHASRFTPHASRFTPHGLAILPGADNAFEPDILNQLEQGIALYLAHPTNQTNQINQINQTNQTNQTNPTNQTNQTTKPTFRYVLLELPDYFLFPQVKDLIRKLREGSGLL